MRSFTVITIWIMNFKSFAVAKVATTGTVSMPLIAL